MTGRLNRCIVCTLAVWTSLSSAAYSESSLSCSIGPAPVPLGSCTWNAFSCNDGASIIFLTPEEAQPTLFYFLYLVQNGEHRLVGEGNGDHTITKEAYDLLISKSEADYAEIRDATLMAPQD